MALYLRKLEHCDSRLTVARNYASWAAIELEQCREQLRILSIEDVDAFEAKVKGISVHLRAQSDSLAQAIVDVREIAEVLQTSDNGTTGEA